MISVRHLIATASTANASSYVSGAFTPVAGELLVAMVVASDTAAGPSMTNSAGLTMTLRTNAIFRTSLDGVLLYTAGGPAAASSQTVTFNCTDPATGTVIFVAGVSGAGRYGADAQVQVVSRDNQPIATPTITFGSATHPANATILCIGNSTSPAGLTAPTGWTEDAAGDTGYSTPTTGAEYVYRNSGFTGTAVTWGSGSASAWGGVGIELHGGVHPSENRSYPQLLPQ